MSHDSSKLILVRLTRAERLLHISAFGWVCSLLGLVVFGLGVQHATSQQTALRARSLEIVDGSGKVRIEMKVVEGQGLRDAQIWLKDGSGDGQLLLDAPASGKPHVTLYGDGWISLYNTATKADVSLNMRRGVPNLEVTDAEGYSAALGGTELTASRTGSVEKRSAASLVLFDKAGKVIWSAP